GRDRRASGSEPRGTSLDQDPDPRPARGLGRLGQSQPPRTRSRAGLGRALEAPVAESLLVISEEPSGAAWARSGPSASAGRGCAPGAARSAPDHKEPEAAG